MNFDFLKNTTLTVVEKTVAKSSTGKTAMQRNPTNGASLRLFKDGSVYPSMDAVTKYNLEYSNFVPNNNTLGYEEYVTPNGFDVIDSRKWSQYPSNAQPVVFIAAVPKKSGLVDLFASAKVEGTSVMTQGSKTFGLELITMLQEVYNVELFTTQKWVDLTIVDNVELPSLDGIYNVPKTVAKGENKGMVTTKRRENITVNPLALFTVEAMSTEDNEVQEFEEMTA